MKRRRLVALAVGGLVALGGCATEPSEDELAEAILVAVNADVEIQVTEDVARCIARELLASRLSDTTLDGLSENFDNPEVLETEADDVEPLVAAAAAACR